MKKPPEGGLIDDLTLFAVGAAEHEAHNKPALCGHYRLWDASEKPDSPDTRVCANLVTNPCVDLIYGSLDS